eukprot:7935289-Ditylum_brightwellii.AAC.1
MCVRLEEAELQKLRKKKIACAMKEHDNSDGKRKRQEKPKSRHKRYHGSGKHHQIKHRKEVV